MSITAPNGLVTTNLYGSDGFLSQQIVQGFSTNSYTYSSGLVLSHTDARSYDQQYLGRFAAIAASGLSGRHVRHEQLQRPRPCPGRGPHGFPTSFGYDSMRRRTSETNALNNSTHYNYCTCGSLDSIQDAAGNYTFFFYDNAARLTNTVYADGYSTTTSTI